MLGPPGSGTSSRMRTFGFRMMARARDSRCRWPPDRSLSVTCARTFAYRPCFSAASQALQELCLGYFTEPAQPALLQTGLQVCS